jgi:hypothetical protein
MEEKAFDYDVALSFAGEDRQIAKDIATRLNGSGVSVFYDNFQEAELWGKNLYEFFASVFSERARYCLMLVSRHYLQKSWTRHERQHAQVRALREGGEYILPLRLDDTELPGLPSTVGYIDLRGSTVSKVTEMLVAKIQASSLVEPSDHVGQIPEVLRHLPNHLLSPLSIRGELWEHDFFSNVLTEEIESARGKNIDLRYGMPSDDLHHLTFGEYFAWVSRRIELACRKVDALSKLCADGFLQAVGEPGREGNPVEMYEVAKRIGAVYHWAVRWAGEFQSLLVPREMERLLKLQAAIPQEIMTAIEQIPKELSDLKRRWLDSSPEERENFGLQVMSIDLVFPNKRKIAKEQAKLRQLYNWQA